MTAQEFIRPTSLEEALAIKSELGEQARVVAGATDLILRMRDGVFTPHSLIDVRRLPLGGVDFSADTIHLGAGLTLSRMLSSEALIAALPSLADACRQFAGPPIRNRATLGGNLVNASPAADLVPPLLAHDALVVLTSLTGERMVPLQEFFIGPGLTVMQADEILTSVRIPVPPPVTGSAFIKLGHRKSMAISIVSLCARLTLDPKGSVTIARIALGAVAPRPIRALGAERILKGGKLSDRRILRAAVEATGETSPISDVRASKDYRLRMTRVLVRRGLESVRESLAGSNGHD